MSIPEWPTAIILLILSFLKSSTALLTDSTSGRNLMFDPGPGFENLLEEEHLSRQERLFCDIFLRSEFLLDLMSARSTLGDEWWYKKSPVCGREIHLLNLISRVTSRLKEVPNFGAREMRERAKYTRTRKDSDDSRREGIAKHWKFIDNFGRSPRAGCSRVWSVCTFSYLCTTTGRLPK